MRTFQIKREPQQIEKLLGEINAQLAAGGTKYRGLSYEEGIDAAIRWLTGETDDHPYED